MQDKQVLTIDDDKVGHVVGEEGDFLLVEHGLLKSKHAIPRAFIEENGDHYRTTLSKQLIHESPKLHNGDFDRQAIAEHYGLAEGYEDPITRGQGEMLADDPARSAEQDAVRAGVDPVQERVATREAMSSGEGRLDQGDSPGLTGGDRFRDAPGGKKQKSE